MKISKDEERKKQEIERVLSHVSGGAREKNLGCTHDDNSLAWGGDSLKES